MGEGATTNVRERVWIDVIDHEQEPPRMIRQIFFENGELQAVNELTTTGETPRPVDVSTLSR